MSYSGSNAHELTARLLAALDSQYDVLDMHAVNEIISVLEKIHITKELLETTRLGKHVNLLRRRAKDPTLARRAKLLVKRWRDLVIPASSTKQNANSTPGPAPSRTSAERQVRPLTSPALTRHVLSPVVASPKSSSRPGWSGYDSDSQDVILVDDDPPEPPPLVPPRPAPVPAAAPSRAPASAPHTPTRRPASPSPTSDAKQAKRDKKPKKKRGHSRAGSGSESSPAEAWTSRNGASPAPAPPPAPAAAVPPRRNGCRKPQLDAYSTLIHKLPPAGAKKVKTTKELLEEIQSRGSAPSPPARLIPSPAPHSPEVLLVDSPEPHEYVTKASPLRNGGDSPLPPRAVSPAPRSPYVEPVYPVCSCPDDEADSACEANCVASPSPLCVWTLHHAHVHGVNGTRAPPAPHPHAVRPPTLPDAPGLFASVVPLYRYLDYADDYCVKNLSHVDLCPTVPPDEFAPSPPPLPPPPSPPPIRPYPVEDLPPPVDPTDHPPSDSEPADHLSIKSEPTDHPPSKSEPTDHPPIKSEITVLLPNMADHLPFRPDSSAHLPFRLDPTDHLLHSPRLKCDTNSDSEDNGPINRLQTLNTSDASIEMMDVDVPSGAPCEDSETLVDSEINLGTNSPEEQKVYMDGRTLYKQCVEARSIATLSYSDVFAAPAVSMNADGLMEAFSLAESATERDELERPTRSSDFAEWHEPARLTSELVALPYVVID